jgi:cystathionine beta-lyase
MGQYNFDEIIDRRGTSCLKHDFGMERKGRDDLLPMWVADMDFRLPEEVIWDIQERVSHGIFGYTDPKQDYRDALRGWFKRRHGVEIMDEWNIITPGVVYAIATAVRALTSEGDSVLIQQPVYYPFREEIELNNRKVVNNRLLYKNGRYEIDFDDFERKVREEHVKLFILCSPHNPVGRVWSRDELKRMADICRENDVYVFADEIHADFVYEGFRHTSYLELGDEYRERLIIGTSPSKTFNIAGLQIVNILIPNKRVRDACRKENRAAGYSQCSAIGLTATISAYTKGDRWLDELIPYLEGNVNFVRAFLRENLPKVHLVEPEGTYLVWLDFSEVTQDPAVLKRLIVDKARLWLDSGRIFGGETALFERINIACPRAVVEQAFEQLYEAMSKQG